jgi:hypothetical protein
LHICESTLGSNHPDIASVVNNPGSLLLDLGHRAGAKAAFEQALRSFKRSLPVEYPNIKNVQGNLAAP